MVLPENDKDSSHRMLEVVNRAVYLFDLKMFGHSGILLFKISGDTR